MDEKKIKKVTIAGLANSGKSSILKVFSERSLEGIINIKVTHGIKYRKFDLVNCSFQILDLGGQDLYIKRYLNEKKPFFLMNELIFLIDIQDRKVFRIAIEYLRKIIKIIDNHDTEELSQDFKIFVFLHKADPKLMKSGKLNRNIEQINVKLQRLLANYTYEIHSTSVFAYYDSYHPLSFNEQQFPEKSNNFNDLHQMILLLTEGLHEAFERVNFKVDAILDKQDMHKELIETRKANKLKVMIESFKKVRRNEISRGPFTKNIFSHLGPYLINCFKSLIIST